MLTKYWVFKDEEPRRFISLFFVSAQDLHWLIASVGERRAVQAHHVHLELCQPILWSEIPPCVPGDH